MAAGFKGLFPPTKGSSRLSYSDGDGLIIDGCAFKARGIRYLFRACSCRGLVYNAWYGVQN
ncbi:hypothetical protein HGT73_04165 [Rosenbergiella australiborealis]|uniref:Uncharacterized protein n=1 Tax=Rosenbergiella australiborealis TaxID=1544696 RepID=A0ABS5T6I0_9GAMM|nr:hypothetical protein [Rosenbergiella australiborealis]